jgi:cytochrome P450
MIPTVVTPHSLTTLKTPLTRKFDKFSRCTELARHPELLKKARVEQLQLASKGDLDLEQLGKMPYLEQVLWEVERLHQPVGGGFRGVI